MEIHSSTSQLNGNKRRSEINFDVRIETQQSIKYSKHWRILKKTQHNIIALKMISKKPWIFCVETLRK